MRVHNSIEEDGKRWDLWYEHEWEYERDDDGEFARDEKGELITRNWIQNLKWFGDDGLERTLPPWATVDPEWFVTLCWFDEDEETGELTNWELRS